MKDHTQSPGDVREDWASRVRGWVRWEACLGYSTWPVTQRMLLGLGVGSGARVLDVGSGLGDPAVQIASAIAPGGTVLGIDATAEMVEAARRRAESLGLSNVSFLPTGIEGFDSGGDTFDAITARFAIMFIEDLDAGLGKMFSLLKPGGRLALSVWASADENPMFRIPREALASVVERGRTGKNGPGPLRLSKPGELLEVVSRAGFGNVRVDDVDFYTFARDPGDYFQMVYDMTPMFAEAYDVLPEPKQQAARRALMNGVSIFETDGVIRVPARARVGFGVRIP